MIDELRDIKIDIVSGKYKCISAYKIPVNPSKWLNCPNCGLKPLIWEFNNGSSTGCGCGENEYNHFSIWTESIMSYISRHGGSALNYDSDKLRKNWNHWVHYGEELEPREELLKEGKW
jgi:hypothetical protein